MFIQQHNFIPTSNRYTTNPSLLILQVNISRKALTGLAQLIKSVDKLLPWLTYLY